MRADDRVPRLSVLAETISACDLCALASTRSRVVVHRGNPFASLMLIGEAPGEEEDLAGMPFVGRSGRLLDSLLLEVGLTPEQYYIANAIKCRPPGNRTPLPEEQATCADYLRYQIHVVSPRLIVAFGKTAHRALGLPEAEWRGHWRAYTNPLDDRRYRVLSTFHPAYVLRNPGSKTIVKKDLSRAATELRRIDDSDDAHAVRQPDGAGALGR